MAPKHNSVSPIGEGAGSAVQRRRSQAAYRELERKYEQSMAIADLVVLHRARFGLTQRELARRMGTSETAIARLESGFHMPSTETLRRLAAALGGRLTIGIEFGDSSAADRRSGRKRSTRTA
jgi:ribosome-binding protein aMBF1 (putative translation factor)